MSTNSHKHAFAVVNSFLSQYLDKLGVLSSTMNIVRGGRTIEVGTIVSEEMIPEAAGPEVGDNSYIVFELPRNDETHHEYQKHETIAYRVYAQSKVSAMEIAEGIIDCLGRRDFTIDDLDTFQIDSKGKATFYFSDIEYNVLEVAAAINQGTEAGYFTSTILIQYGLIYDVDSNGRRIM